MMRRTSSQCDRQARRGALVPAVVMALLVVGLALALVLDRLWIDAARVELSAAAEAAALRAAHVLASDDRLLTEPDDAVIAEAARQAAAEVAARNLVAGQPVELDTASDGDVRFGRIVPDAGGRGVFLETDHQPTTVVVLTRRMRSRANPLGLFLQRLTGQGAADVAAFAEASIDGRVVGVRPFEGANVPAIPLAILEQDATGRYPETWMSQVEQRQGGDAFGFDEESGLVTQVGDGIPEIALHAAAGDANMHWIDIGNGLRDPLIAAQIDAGLTTEQLSAYDGALRLDDGPLRFAGGVVAVGAATSALAGMIGKQRICFLANPILDTAGESFAVDVRRMAAVRVMQVNVSAADAVEIIVQPTLVCTRTAILPENPASPPATNESSAAAAYVYKLHLTR